MIIDISAWNWSNTIDIWSALWVLMAWCFSTRASVATVLSTHTCVYGLTEFCEWWNDKCLAAIAWVSTLSYSQVSVNILFLMPIVFQVLHVEDIVEMTNFVMETDSQYALREDQLVKVRISVEEYTSFNKTCLSNMLMDYNINLSDVIWWYKSGQHLLRWWLVACWHQAITWACVESKVFCGIHLRAISQEVLSIP